MLNATLVEPAFHTSPKWSRSLGPEVADLCELAGFGPFPEQRLFLDDLFAIDKNDRSVSFEAAVICARQNLKTGALKQAALGWLFLMDQPLTVWSAQEFRTSQEAFRDLSNIIDGSDYLRRRVKAIYRGNGDESIELTSGARLIFKARTSGGGRGLTGHKVILDEAYALQPQHMGALLPTLMSVPDPQVVYASSAGMATSEILRSIRDRGRKGSERMTYSEWCSERGTCESDHCDHVQGTPGCLADDPEMWVAANPVHARRDPSMAAVRALRDSLPPEEFVRECMGWWDDPADSSMAGIDPAAWAACGDLDSRRSGRITIGVDMTPDRSTVNLAIVADRADGVVHGELIESRRGATWVIGRLKELTAQHNPTGIVVDNGSPAGSLIPEMERAGLHLFQPNVGEYSKACGELHDLVVSKSFAHIDQHPLNAAVEGARAHALGRGQWVWRPRSTVSISPLIALTNALAGHESNLVNDPVMNIW
jgi:hypothetical protein